MRMVYYQSTQLPSLDQCSNMLEEHTLTSVVVDGDDDINLDVLGEENVNDYVIGTMTATKNMHCKQ